MVSSVLGIGGGAGGTGFGTPQQVQIDPGATVAQANTLYQTNQDALNQQQQFAQQAAGFGGLGLQTQQNTINQLQNVANGQGPNPAQTMLNQATGQNVANQAALMAGQRGSGANIGLMARQAAQQGAQTQQQAIGQNAALQSQQSLNALSSIGNLATQQAGQGQTATSAYTGAAQGEQANVLNAIEQQNAARAGVQSSINSANASMANTRMGQQGQMMSNMTGGIGSMLSMAEGGAIENLPQLPNQYTASSMPQQVSNKPTSQTTGPRSSIAKFFSGMSKNSNQPASESTGQQIGKAIGKGITSLFSSSSADHATTAAATNPYSQYEDSGFTADQMSNAASRQDAINAGGIPAPSELDQNYGQQNTQVPLAASNEMPVAAAKGGRIQVLLSPGEKKLTPSQAKKVASGGKVEGTTVPGEAPVKGAVDSYTNDIVKDDAEPGTIILPRSVTQSKNPHWAAHKFVSAIMAKQGNIPSKKSK